MYDIHRYIPTCTSSGTNNALVTGKGKDYTQYLHYIRPLGKEYGIENIPNITEDNSKNKK